MSQERDKREVYQRTDFDIQLRREDVFAIMDCHEDSPVYDILVEEYEEWEERISKLVKPCAILVWDVCDRTYGRLDLIEGKHMFYVFQSVGGSLSEESTRLFSQGDTLGGMMVDAIADAALTELNRQVSLWLREICQKKQLGILRRLECPMQLPMEAQEWILHKTGAQEGFGVTMTSGYMFCPVKSIGYVLLSTEDTAVFKDSHNCRACERKDCKMRNVEPVIIKLEGEKKGQIICTGEQTIMDALVAGGYSYAFPCGGRGTCGKCRIRVLEGEQPVTKSDKDFFDEEELKQGYRLACQAYPVEDLTIQFCGERGESFEVLSKLTTAVTEHAPEAMAPYVIAIDIGTTTLAVSLVDSKTGQALQVHTAMNRQRSLGADVIARIQASCEGRGEELQRLIREDLLAGIEAVMAQAEVSESEIGQIAIAGNTTMGHLLMGLSCETLGVSPFTPVDISMRRLSFGEVFGTENYSIPVLLLPGISTYVGADITAGMLSLGFAKNEETALFIDLGTNGEMAIGNKDRILVTSTAAGPAFEGGNISCGIGSVTGAISDVVIEEVNDRTNVRLQTIGNAAAAGICGTGAIAIVSELLQKEWLDETGLLDEEYFEEGFVLGENVQGEEISFTQKDVREMQLAKAAVRAGLETLLVHYGVDYEGVDKVYLAGGFGYKMNLDKAVGIGLLPQKLRDKVEAVGNSSLSGARDALLSASAMEAMEHICKVSQEINLSTDKEFNEFYMEHMMFE